MNEWMGGEMDGWTDGRMNGWIPNCFPWNIHICGGCVGVADRS